MTILWPDVEQALIEYLGAGLDSTVFVGNLLPIDRPDYAVTVRNDGGSAVDTAFAVSSVGINIWAPTKPEAIDLAALVSAHLNAANTPVITEASASLGFEVPDDSEQPHYYVTASVRVRGANI